MNALILDYYVYIFNIFYCHFFLLLDTKFNSILYSLCFYVLSNRHQLAIVDVIFYGHSLVIVVSLIWEFLFMKGKLLKDFFVFLVQAIQADSQAYQTLALDKF